MRPEHSAARHAFTCRAMAALELDPGDPPPVWRVRAFLAWLAQTRSWRAGTWATLRRAYGELQGACDAGTGRLGSATVGGKELAR